MTLLWIFIVILLIAVVVMGYLLHSKCKSSNSLSEDYGSLAETEAKARARSRGLL